MTAERKGIKPELTREEHEKATSHIIGARNERT